ncbi:hypothetical protein Hanom_Chr05g00427171 [Helianthus anomalus]
MHIGRTNGHRLQKTTPRVVRKKRTSPKNQSPSSGIRIHIMFTLPRFG